MRKKILVVDDNEGILDAMQVMLETAGYDVQTSPDGEILETIHAKDLPDVMLLDVLLSGRDGRELCAKLKKSHKTKHVPVIMISAEPRAADSVKACGADDFLAKPFAMHDLLRKIDFHSKEVN